MLSPTSGKTQAGVGVRNIVRLNFRTNDTGLSRTATINVSSYFNGSCRVVQYPYINIIYPARQQADGTYVFEHRLQASATTMQFVYNAFATQPSVDVYSKKVFSRKTQHPAEGELRLQVGTRFNF